MKECQVPLDASAVASDVDYDDEWELDGGVRLNDLMKVYAIRRLRDFQDSCRPRNRRVLKTFAEAFAFCSRVG